MRTDRELHVRERLIPTFFEKHVFFFAREQSAIFAIFSRAIRSTVRNLRILIFFYVLHAFYGVFRVSYTWKDRMMAKAPRAT